MSAPSVAGGPSTADSPSIVVVGSINADLMIGVERHPLPGETLVGSGGTILPGGKGANQAAAAALLGGRVAMVGAVGDDANATPATAVLHEAGVDMGGVRTVPGPTGVAVVVVDAKGENSIIIIEGANGSVDAAAVAQQRDMVAGAEVVVLQGEIPRDGIEQAAALASGRLVINLAPVVEVDPDVLRAADPLVVNEHEGALALRILDPGTTPPADEADLVRAIRAAGVPSVVMTVGAEGAIVADGNDSDRDRIVRLPSARVDVVDSTGAGDAFVGALAWRLAAGDSLVDASRMAVRVGAFACMSAGAQSSYPRAGDELPHAEPPADPTEARR